MAQFAAGSYLCTLRALQATRAALEEGIVPGGGVALLSAIAAIKLDGFGDPDERTGAQIIVRALEEPVGVETAICSSSRSDRLMPVGHVAGSQSFRLGRVRRRMLW
jgi:hypothetical protein